MTQIEQTINHTEISRRRFMAGVAAFTLAGGGFAATKYCQPKVALAETSAEVRAQANEVLQKLEALSDDLDIKSNTYYTCLEEEQEAERLMEDAQRRIDEAQAKIDKLKQRLATRVRGMYKSGDTSFLDILFGSTSFSAFINNVQILNEMNQNDTDTVEQTKVLKAQIEEEKAEYTRQEAIAEAKRIEAEEIMKEAQAIVDEIQAIYDALDAKANRLLREEIAAERARQAAILAAQQAAEQAALGNNGGGSSGSGSSGGSTWTNTGNAIVDRAGKWIGNAKYVWAACAPGKFDCSGLVAYAVTGQYARIGTTWTFVTNTSRFKPLSWSDARPGDIAVVHNSAKQHTGIYTGGNYMIHAASESLGVIHGWFDKNVYSCVRYMG